jgi:hypothetical protein
MASRSRTTAPPRADLPFCIRAITSITNSDDPHVIGHLLAHAAAEVESLLQHGIFACEAIEPVVGRIVRAYERADKLTINYAGDVAALEQIDGTLANSVLRVRYEERDAAYALGLAVGLRMGGTR